MILNGLIFLLLLGGVLLVVLFVLAAAFVVKVLRVLHLDSLLGGRAGFKMHGGPAGDESSAETKRTSGKHRGNVVIDTRTEETAKRKIFDSNDGEYVDYIGE
jgi:hypothetical protein